MYSESFEKAYKKILKAEGGYVESSSEGGGAANAGITLTRYRTFLGNNNATKEDLRKISEAHKKEIYKQEWDVVGGDQIQDKRIANILFDQSVNKGPRVIKDMQRTLGMTPTGNITDVVSTLNAKSFEENTEVGNKFVDRQFKDYASIAQRNPEKAKFLNGWNKRLSKVANENGITGASPEATEETFINEKRASSPYSPDENPFLLQKKTEEEDREALQNISVIDNGQFRFNDILLDIPPEQISVIMDEYESSLLLMRQDIPVTAQSGKKRVRIIVNFPYDFAMGWNKLAKMIIQIRKTPIATIENEKIRKELFGEIEDFSNIGVVVDNLSGYVEEDYPTLLRCSLQMSWFNHSPYVEDIKYVSEENGRLKTSYTPSQKFSEFYKAGTSNGLMMINDPSVMNDDQSLVIMYKEYQEFKETVTKSQPSRSKLSGEIKGSDNATIETALKLQEKGWYLANQKQKDIEDEKVIDGIFYRWRKFVIGNSSLNLPGSLILQNMSFSLNTNPSYISMESYSIPTIQFLGGSFSELRALIFAAPETGIDNSPSETSFQLSSLMALIKKVSEERLKYPKYAKENHMLISHPLAKLMKYKSDLKIDNEFVYVDSLEGVKNFNIDEFLPVIVSSSSSSTIPGLPYASNVQLDFKETRLAKNTKGIKYKSQGGSGSILDHEKVKINILKLLALKHEISFDSKAKRLSGINAYEGAFIMGKVGIDHSVPAFWPSTPQYKKNKFSPDAETAEQLLDALNNLRAIDLSVTSLDSAFRSRVFLSNASEGADLSNQIGDAQKERARINNILANGARNARGNTYEVTKPQINLSEVLTKNAVDQMIINLYVSYGEAIANGDSWATEYISLFEEFSKINPEISGEGLYPDIMLPETESNPAYYFANNKKRTETIKGNILKRLPANAAAIQEEVKEVLISENIKKYKDAKDPSTGKKIINVDLENIQYGPKGYAPAMNHSAKNPNKGSGTPKGYEANDFKQRELTTEMAMFHATAPIDSLEKVYPAFKVHLYSDRFIFNQKYSASDLTANDLNSSQQIDLLDVYDLSSILDIRIIKDEYEAADAMIIRILNTKKELMTTQGKDPTYNEDTFSVLGDGGLIDNIFKGVSVLNPTKNHNLEDIGLKEGTRIKAFLGYGSDLEELGLEFTGKIAAINGKDVIEIYCLGDGHELIQDTKGYDKAKKITMNSETVDLIGEILAEAEEVKSFGETKYQISKAVKLKLPDSLGGQSALDNITAPSLWPKFNWGDFAVDSALGGVGLFSGAASVATMASPLLAATKIGLLIPGLNYVTLVAIGAAFLASVAYQSYVKIANTLNPCQYNIYQQTIWDILQEMTLRHPGYVCRIVPFDNRSTIFFGEPDTIYFSRGIQSALERSIITVIKLKHGKNTTLREAFDKNITEKFVNNLSDSSYPFVQSTAKDQTNIKNKAASLDPTQIALLNMKKPFRNYHIVTSEHDIISNSIEASSVGVANSVQVYYPDDNNEQNQDGKTWLSDYSLTDKMKADDDLLSNFVNNKVFTFHNAHNEDEELELPQRYAKAILCKELENIYRGKLTILGRAGIKPHDIIILGDNYNRISGPCGVRRVVQTLSPSTGWVTSIYPKFIAIPDSSAGAFQMKTILKASRYWLGAQAELFYSNMEKFRPSEIADSDKFTGDLSRAVELAVNGEGMDDELTKSDIETGEESALRNSFIGKGSGSALDLTTDAVGVVSNKLQGGSNVITGKIVNDSIDLVGGVKTEGANAFKAAKNLELGKTIGSTWKGTKVAGKLGGKVLLRGASGFFGGYIVEQLITGIADGFISWMKYRQPISIFPLTKEGKPWLAGLNGYTENTAMEHLKLQAVRGSDKAGFMYRTAKELLENWIGDVDPDVGYGGDYQVSGVAEDGDTIYIKNGNTTEKIRILGFDAGEIKSEGKTTIGGPNELEMGLIAKKRVDQLIKENGGTVTIVRHGPENYGRTLAEASIKVKAGNKEIKDILREEGLVLYYTGAPKNKYYEQNGGREAVWGKMLEEYKKRNPEKFK